jgi:AraC family transcriptional regulator
VSRRHETFAGHVHRTIPIGDDIAIYDVSHQPLQVIARHEHASARMAITIEGTLTERGDGWSEEFGPDSVIFWPPGATHEDRVGTSLNRSVQIDLSDEIFAKVGNVFPRSTTCLGAELFDGAVRAFLRELEAPDAATPVAIEGALYTLVTRAHRILAAATLPGLAVTRAADFVARNFNRRLTVADIGASVGLSTRAIRQRFQDELGLSPNEQLRRTRLEAAARSLATTDLPIGGIAIACGFYDQAHLSREFQRRFGTTPRAYRNQRRSPAALRMV